MGGVRLAVGVVVLVLLTSAPRLVAAQSHDAVDPAALVRRYVAALNAEDLATALACFADDAIYAGGAGKDFIRARLERDFSVDRRMAITALTVSGNTVTWWWEAREDPYGRLNVPPIAGMDVSVVENGVIVSNSGAVDPDSVRRQQAAIPVALAALAAQRQAQATQAAQATQVASSGLLQRLPDTQQRGAPPAVPWAATAAVLLGTTVALAALKRPPRPI